MTTNKQEISVLIVEDSKEHAVAYCGYLDDQPYKLSIVENGVDALKYLSDNQPEVVLLDLMLPDIHGSEILKYIQTNEMKSQVIIVTGHGSVDYAVDAMRNGAFDFITKPVDAEHLRVSINNAVQLHTSLIDKTVTKHGGERNRYHGFIGKSSPMQEIYTTIDHVASSHAPVFITGESGTGKEICAHAIHKESDRSNEALISLNCAAIPEELIESEIFGHVKGAFTGANSDRVGAAKLADGGTLFLDEICEMNILLQCKLLRFLQTGTYRPVGSDKEVTVDIRFISATNKDPLIEISAGRFREDLYYRLHVIPLYMPPLRSRGNDVLLLANYLIKQIAKEENKSFDYFTDGAEELIENYSWPGNVRQLLNVLRAVIVLKAGGVIDDLKLKPFLLQTERSLLTIASGVNDGLPSGETSINHNNAVLNPDDIQPLWETEKQTINCAIQACDGNVQRAASMLKVSASTIYRKLNSWNNTSITESSKSS